jgi:hypothetical protein
MAKTLAETLAETLEKTKTLAETLATIKTLGKTPTKDECPRERPMPRGNVTFLHISGTTKASTRTKAKVLARELLVRRVENVKEGHKGLGVH